MSGHTISMDKQLNMILKHLKSPESVYAQQMQYCPLDHTVKNTNKNNGSNFKPKKNRGQYSADNFR